MCCALQPPHTPKWRHSGGWRSGLGADSNSGNAAVPRRTRSPGKAKGTYEGPAASSAMPSPRAPRPTISSAPSSAMDGSEQKFLIAGAAGNRRGDHPGNAPARAIEPGAHAINRALPLGRIADDAALAHRLAPGLELRLDQRNQPGVPVRPRQRRRQRLAERDEADIGDDGADQFGDVARIERARIAALKRHHRRQPRQTRVQLTMADVDGVDPARAGFEQHLGEAAGRGADVESDNAGDG